MDVVDISDKRIARYQVPVDDHGRRLWLPQEEVDSSNGAHANWPDRFFAKITGGYLMREGNRGGRVGDGPSYLFRAAGLLEYTLPVMRAVAADPHAADTLTELA